MLIIIDKMPNKGNSSTNGLCHCYLGLDENGTMFFVTAEAAESAKTELLDRLNHAGLPLVPLENHGAYIRDDTGSVAELQCDRTCSHNCVYNKALEKLELIRELQPLSKKYQVGLAGV